MKMSDKELLELAATAAGVNGVWHEWWDDLTDSKSCGIAPKNACGRDWWNPLNDESEAFRLAAKLNMVVDFSGAENDIESVMKTTCLAIVKAAAEIGRGMI
jgi:hypothetical protein